MRPTQSIEKVSVNPEMVLNINNDTKTITIQNN